MRNGRARRAKGDAGRDSGGFVALPWKVLDCPAYQQLSHPARSLLMELARQFVGDNNGRLLASKRHLATRGWRSADVIDRAKRELLEAGFIFETVKGHRPNKASWYAVTWRTLDRRPDYDPGAIATFERGAYAKNAPLRPRAGPINSAIGPSHGPAQSAPIPLPGTAEIALPPASAPPDGHHLELPSAGATAESCADKSSATSDWLSRLQLAHDDPRLQTVASWPTEPSGQPLAPPAGSSGEVLSTYYGAMDAYFASRPKLSQGIRLITPDTLRQLRGR